MRPESTPCNGHPHSLRRWVGWFAALALATAPTLARGSTITAASATKNAGNTADFTNNGTLDGRQWVSAVVASPTIDQSSTHFLSRYSAVDCADSGAFTNSRQQATANYSVGFTVNGTGPYKVVVTTSWLGALTGVDDGGASSTATLPAMSGSYTAGPGVFSGNLTLTPGASQSGNGGFNVQFGSTSVVANITGNLGGSPTNQSHTLTYSSPANGFDANSPGGSALTGGDEAAVRLGIACNLSGQSAGTYPGPGGRTAANDGHFVDVKLSSYCGDGSIDASIGEACDDGVNNGTAGSCCATDCTFKTAGTGCTDDGNVCTNDVCNGASNLCTHPNNTASCNDGLFCNGADTCSGGNCSVHAGNPCPGPDGDGNCSESCNEAADNCTAPDPNGSACNDGLFCNGADTCNGGACSAHTGDPCPGPNGDGNCSESCNEAADNCTAPDPNGSACNDGLFCNGSDTCSGGNCSAHTGDPCPGPNGDGNCSESCNEAANNCTAPDPNGSACNDGLFCDGADTCSGGSCTAHAGDPCTGGPECANTCNEGANNCFDPAGTACTDDGETCTTDTCNGTGTCAHPAGHTGAVCRPGSGDSCDPAEHCDGTTPTCPADVVTASGTVCRTGSGDLCDPDETCTGVAGQPCPTDSVSGAFVTCRPAAGPCDVAENCTGVRRAALPERRRRALHHRVPPDGRRLRRRRALRRDRGDLPERRLRAGQHRLPAVGRRL